MSFIFFHKTKEQEGRTGPDWGVPVGGGRMWEKAWEGEYGANIVYTCM
jgi:hypothetical protein